MKGLCHVCMSSNKDVEINKDGVPQCVAYCGAVQ